MILSYRFYRATLCVKTVLAVGRCPSVGLSVRLSVIHVYCIQTVKNSITLFSLPHHSGFLEPKNLIPRGTHSAETLNTREWENLRYSTEIAVYLVNGTR